MKFSINTIRFLNQHYGSASEPAEEGVDALLAKIGAQLGGIEETIPFGERFKDVIIAKVVSCRKHENSDHLNICLIDDGRKVEGVERDADGLVQVVCGAPNVHEGLLVAWLPPGTAVPESIAKGEPFVLEARDIRGERSNGMLASARELSIGDNHDGILEIDFDNDEHAPMLGTRFAEAGHLDGDVVVDIENKMFTHRPDCFGWLGIAREIEGIHGRPYKSPAWYALNAQPPEARDVEPLPLHVRNELPELVPRFVAMTMRDVEVKPSPLWLQLDLARAGIRPINNIVDYANLFMLETGQPLHAYDYDKVCKLDADHTPVQAALHAEDHSPKYATLVVRHSNKGEKIKLLNGKEIEPREQAIMIATATQAIGVGGVMGGCETEVDEHTRNIILECATFDMYSIRKTSMEHGLFTDAVTRFSKGQSPLQNRAVICKIADEITRFAGGKVAGLVDDNHIADEVMQRGSLHPPVRVSPDFINARLGLALSAAEMCHLLENVEFTVANDSPQNELVVSAPFWRTDIEIPEDIVEEIGRLYGYDQLPLDLPRRSIAPAAQNPMLAFKERIRTQLAKSGANEVLTYSFVHGNLLDKVGQNRAQAFQLSNALSPDLQYLRLSLLPGILDKVHINIKAGHNAFALFEMGMSHNVADKDAAGLPSEHARLALVYAANDKFAQAQHAGAPYYQARVYAEELLHGLGLHDCTFIEYQQVDGGSGAMDSWQAPFTSGRSAVVMATVGGHPNTIVGFVGEFRQQISAALKLPAFCAGFEFDLNVLHDLASVHQVADDYTRLPAFPKVEQDICLKVAADLSYQTLYDFSRDALATLHLPNTVHSLRPLDIYQREDDTEHKQITFRFSIASYEKTLRDEEVTHLLDGLAARAQEKFGAERL